MSKNKSQSATGRQKDEFRWVAITPPSRETLAAMAPEQVIGVFAEQLARLLWRQVMEKRRAGKRSI